MAQDAKETKRVTADVLIISGSRSVYRFVKNDLAETGGKETYLTRQSLTLRNPGQGRLMVKIWTKGLPELSFDWPQRPDPSGPSCGKDYCEIPLDPGKAEEIRYVIAVAKAGSLKAQGTILVSAGGLPPESIPIAVETPESWDTRIIFPVITGLIGVGLGTFFGFLSFLVQQRYLRNQEQRKVYQENVANKAGALQSFFDQDFNDLLGDPGEWSELRLKDLRLSLINRGVYGIMPPADRVAFDNVCELRCDVAQRNKLLLLVENNFGQFVKKP